MKTLFRRILIAILSAALLLPVITAVPAGVSASGNNATLSVGKVTAEPGQTVEIPVTVSNNPGICAFMIGFDYDHDLLTVLNAETPESVSGKSTFSKLIVWIDGGDYTGDGTIFIVTVAVSPNAKPGTFIPFTLSFNDGDITNYDEQDVYFTLEGRNYSSRKLQPVIMNSSILFFKLICLQKIINKLSVQIC